MPKKHTFILAKIKCDEVDIKYGFNLISNIGAAPGESSQETTLIADLPKTKDSDTCAYSFLDESKRPHSCVVTMQDLITNERLPQETTVKCFWCRSSFSGTPIGCPVSFVPGKVTKTYHSEITKDKYSITDSVTKYRKNLIPKLMEKHQSKFEISENHNEFFLIDGIFCSFNCCMAHINFNRNVDTYRTSRTLLYNLYRRIFSEIEPLKDLEIHKILPAPHWRLLEEYGGHLNIKEFREGFRTVEYVDIDDYVYRMPQCRIIGHVFERKIRF